MPGSSGQNAVAMAVGLGADVTVLDLDIAKLRHLDDRYAGRVRTVVSNGHELEVACLEADLVIGAVLVPGARRPEARVQRSRPADEARLRARRHRDRPGRLLRGLAADHARRPDLPGARLVFYCVANMPGAVPHTSTYALTNATLPYVLRLADLGWEAALAADPALAGLSTHRGALHSLQVAHDLGLSYTEPGALLPA